MTVTAAIFKTLVLLIVMFMTSCRSVPGDTAAEQRTYIDEREQETLQMLYAAHPEARDIIARAPGYLVVDQYQVKVPVFGRGEGHGVLVDQSHDRRLYIKVDRMDIGGGLGARNVRVVLVVHDRKLLKKLDKTPHWSFGGGSEMSSKSGSASSDASSGKSGGGLNNQRARYTLYELTDDGASVTWTIHAIRFSPITPLN